MNLWTIMDIYISMNYYGYLWIIMVIMIRDVMAIWVWHTHTPTFWVQPLMESDLVAMAPWPFKRRSMIFDRQGYQPKVLFLPGECDVIGYLSVVWTSDFIAITKKTQCWCTMHLPLCTPFSGNERFLVGKIMINAIGGVATFMNKLKMNNCVSFCCI